MIRSALPRFAAGEDGDAARRLGTDPVVGAGVHVKPPVRRRLRPAENGRDADHPKG